MSAESEDVEVAAAGARPGPNGWARVTCPLCPTRYGKADRRRSLGINTATGGYVCHRCGAHGRVNDYDPSLTAAPVAVIEPQPQPKMEPPEDFYDLWTEPALNAGCFDAAREYLLRRGVSERVSQEACIGACASGRYRNRVVVPMFDRYESWWGWVGRTWGASSFPYLYPPGMPRGQRMYRDDLLFVETDEPVMVVEGVFDAIAHWNSAVAVLGKPSHAQVDILSRLHRPVAVVLDGDAADESYALAARIRLMGGRAGFVRLPPKVDPDEVDAETLRAAARACIGGEYECS